MVSEEEVIRNYAVVKNNISSVAKECGRDEKDILVVGATKTMPIERIRFVKENTDISVFGENRVQEFIGKYSSQYEWHFIGQLQTNKVKYIIDKVSLIHSVDRISLAEEINRQAIKINKIQDCLIEVNMGSEISKGGVSPDEVVDFAIQLDAFSNVRLSGLMSVLPNVESDLLEKFYLQLQTLYDKLKKINLKNADVRYLSAGMSNDYLTAIKYGANIIRLGRAVFGER